MEQVLRLAAEGAPTREEYVQHTTNMGDINPRVYEVFTQRGVDMKDYRICEYQSLCTGDGT